MNIGKHCPRENARCYLVGKCLERLLTCTNDLLQVDLHDCEIGPSGARFLAAAMENARDAVESQSGGGLTAEANGRTPLPARRIRLQVLRLDGNPLGFSGTSALKPLLSQLKELHLGRADLGDEGDPSWKLVDPCI